MTVSPGDCQLRRMSFRTYRDEEDDEEELLLLFWLLLLLLPLLDELPPPPPRPFTPPPPHPARMAVPATAATPVDSLMRKSRRSRVLSF